MFLSDEDYIVVIGERSLDMLKQSDDNNRIKAENMAIEEMSGYLRPKYDVSAIFSAQGKERNSLVVMYACDISLYHLITSLPGKMGAETREARYKRAIEWLNGVQKGSIVPDIPTAVDESGEIEHNISYGSEKKNNYNW